MKGYRTILFNILCLVLLAVKRFYPEIDVPGEEAINTALDALDVVILFVQGIGNIILRFFTNTKVGEK